MEEIKAHSFIFKKSDDGYICTFQVLLVYNIISIIYMLC